MKNRSYDVYTLDLNEELRNMVRKTIIQLHKEGYDIVYLDQNYSTLSLETNPTITISRYSTNKMFYLKNDNLAQHHRIVIIETEEMNQAQRIQFSNYFLIKPLTAGLIRKTIWEIIKKDQKNQLFQCTVNRKIKSYILRNILYFESNGRKVNIVTEDSNSSFYSKLSEVKKRVEGAGFIQVHQSFLINWYGILFFSKDQVCMKNGDIIPISRSQREIVKGWIQEQPIERL